MFDGENLNNEDFARWLSKRLSKRYINVFNAMKYKGDNRKGRKPKSLEERQAIHNTWSLYSIVTVNRRNGRDQIAISEAEYNQKFNDIKLPEDRIGAFCEQAW